MTAPTSALTSEHLSTASQARGGVLRIILIVILLLLTLVITLFGGVFLIATSNLAPAENAPIISQTTQFDGHYLLTASDADMVGTAYANGVLQQIPGQVDTLSLIELPLRDATARVIPLPASNSVTSWPQIIAVAPNGDAIYVVETAAPVPDDLEQLSSADFPPGRLITQIDLSSGVETATINTFEVAEGASHIAISADGAYLAIGSKEPNRQLAILPIATLYDPTTYAYFSITWANGTAADEISSVYWHPSGDFLAVGISASEIQFYRVFHTESGTLNIEPHGNRITGGYTLTYGQFTRDGNFYLTSEINWDQYPRPLGNLINNPSQMIAIRFDPTPAGAHEIVTRVPVGQSAEGFAINPQEDLIVTVNMQRTYLPDMLSFWPGFHLNSLSLLSFDRQTGQITPLGDPYGFEGVLPEDAMFDSDGDSLGVVIYNERENPMNPGYVEFWNVIRTEAQPRLERTDIRLPVVRGPHAMALIP